MGNILDHPITWLHRDMAELWLGIAIVRMEIERP